MKGKIILVINVCNTGKQCPLTPSFNKCIPGRGFHSFFMDDPGDGVD